MRIETDLIGDVQIPLTSPFGAQTQRAIDLYPLTGGKALSAYPDLVLSLLKVKKAALLTNMEIGEIESEHGQAMLSTIDNLIMTLPNVITRYFPIHAYHGGGGISTNMNLNEVIANLANREHYRQDFGCYEPLHPNNHVNLNHSTSDALNTACNLAIQDAWGRLQGGIQTLELGFEEQANQWRHIKKISRTCLQDAVAISFGDLFDGYNTSIKRSHTRLKQDVESFYLVNMGGSIIGRPGDCSRRFFDSIIFHLRQVTGNKFINRTDDLIDSSQNHDDMVRFASNLDQFALGLIKIAKDLRLMASGPQTGFGEISLPAVQQGSSAMPGKINPTIPEYLIQSCMQVSGYCHTVRMTHSHGELDYTPWQSVVITNLLDAMDALGTAIQVFTQYCVAGIQPNEARNAQNLETIIPTMVSIMQSKGYTYATSLYKDCQGDLNRIRQHIQDGDAL
ncbi:lyase family protein [Marinomonas algicola]|uniref:lyase family protein n=1 Tax=Marinomonas algicola TaxID=2773454 RepID=UPI00174B7F84|nr:lyase family protein [Marinomonas algicola]